jgi:putative transposase
MRRKRAYRYRFYPTADPEDLLARTFGCPRVVYNWAPRPRTDASYERLLRTPPTNASYERHERIG